MNPCPVVLHDSYETKEAAESAAGDGTVIQCSACGWWRIVRVTT